MWTEETTDRSVEQDYVETKEDLLVALMRLDESEFAAGPAAGRSAASSAAAAEAASQPLRLVHTSPVWSLVQRGVSLAAVACLLPVFALGWMLARAVFRGSFVVTRCCRGMDEVPFYALEMRTRRRHGQTDAGMAAAIGRFMRRARIATLLQLWNVVRGEMELIGPRPIQTDLDDSVRQELPRFRERNRVKPGLISFSRIVAFEERLDGGRMCWFRRLKAELYYIRRKSTGYDMVVILMSVLSVLRGIASVLRLRRRRTVRLGVGGDGAGQAETESSD